MDSTQQIGHGKTQTTSFNDELSQLYSEGHAALRFHQGNALALGNRLEQLTIARQSALGIRTADEQQRIVDAAKALKSLLATEE